METQPATRAAWETHHGAVDEFGAVMVRARAPYSLVGVDPEAFDRIDVEPLARESRTHGITLFSRPFDKEGGAYFNTGNHEVVLRQRGFPVGEQEPIGGPFPVVYRPKPLPWDCGTALNTVPAPVRSAPVRSAQTFGGM